MLGVVAKGFRFGLVLSAFGFGFRHGIDWDHIAAITDVTSSQEHRNDSLRLGTIYALGHALVVLALGLVAILIGEKLPPGVDTVMERIVGVTLILLGVYVLVSLAKHGRDFRMRSRWMLLFAGVRKGYRWAKSKARQPAKVTATSGHEHGAGVDDVTSHHHGHHGRLGHHHHSQPEPDDAFMKYGTGTAFTVGMLHGFGAETPTQVLIFLAAAGAGGAGAGIAVLAVFILGLLTSNTLITLTSTFGYLTASRNFSIYATVAVLTGGFSLVIGTMFVFGKSTFLPAFFGG